MTYQEIQEIPSPGLVITLFGWRSRERLACSHKHAMMSWCMLDIFCIGWVWWLDDVLGGGRKEKEVNRLHEVIVPYIAKNLQPYIMRPPVR